MAEATAEYKVIGTRPIRPDGADKVTGRAVYGGDMRLTGMLHGKVLRSPHAHARIKSINTAKAEALPGVKAVITAKDFPAAEDRMANLGEMAVNVKFLSNNVIASDKVLYKGHPVAAVAATSPHIAEEALGLIEVEYEVLPPVLHVLEAMKDEAPLLHETMTTTELGQKTDKRSNIANHMRFLLGDPAQGFREADVVIEREFDTATVHQGYIEPHNATALWNEDGHLYIWTSTQGAFVVQRQAAEILSLPVSQVSVTPCEIGGGFGGKISVYLEPVAAGCICIFSPYAIPNMQVDGYDVVVNKPKTAAYRAPGATNAAFASETVIDEICEQLRIDPLQFRLNNAAKEGTRRADGPTYPRIGYVETVQAALASDHYQTPLEGPHVGRGVASGFWFNVGFQSSVTINVTGDGEVTLVEGSTDIGGTRTSIAMQAAEVLGLPAENAHPIVADTDSVGYTDVTGGSRTTFATGYAAVEAARDVVRQMSERAARLWKVEPQDVSFAAGVFHNAKDPSARLTFKDVAAQLGRTGGPVVGRATVAPRGVGGAFATHIVDLQVDPETGKVTILRYTPVQDAGPAIHPSYVEGQMQGGVVQGMGWARNEEYVYNAQGTMANPSFLVSRMPTSLALPMIDTIIVEVPNPGHPFGVRGVGEVPIVPPPAAIANAIHRAIGIRLRQLPMSPSRVLEDTGLI